MKDNSLAAKSRNPGRESPEFHGVFLRGEISAAAPRFVAHAPEAHVERIFEPAAARMSASVVLPAGELQYSTQR